MIVCEKYFCANFKRRFRIAAAVTVLCLLFCGQVSAQETGYRNFGGKIDSKPMPVPEYEPEISVWLPDDAFEAELDAEFTSRLSPETDMIPMVVYPYPLQQGENRNIYIMPNNTLTIWHINFSNGSAGNWGDTPGAMLDARTLSFPTP